MLRLFLWSAVFFTSVSSVATPTWAGRRIPVGRYQAPSRPIYQVYGRQGSYRAPYRPISAPKPDVPACPNDQSEGGAVFHLHDAEYQSPTAYVFGPAAPGFNTPNPEQPQKGFNPPFPIAQARNVH